MLAQHSAVKALCWHGKGVGICYHVLEITVNPNLQQRAATSYVTKNKTKKRYHLGAFPKGFLVPVKIHCNSVQSRWQIQKKCVKMIKLFSNRISHLKISFCMYTYLIIYLCVSFSFPFPANIIYLFWPSCKSLEYQAKNKSKIRRGGERMLLGQKFPKGQNEMKHFSSPSKCHVSLKERAIFSSDWLKKIARICSYSICFPSEVRL